MPAQIIHFQKRATLSTARLRVVRYLPNAVILTDGKSLSLYVLADMFARTVVEVRGQPYRYARRVRGAEL